MTEEIKNEHVVLPASNTDSSLASSLGTGNKVKSSLHKSQLRSIKSHMDASKIPRFTKPMEKIPKRGVETKRLKCPEEKSDSETESKSNGTLSPNSHDSQNRTLKDGGNSLLTLAMKNKYAREVAVKRRHFARNCKALGAQQNDLLKNYRSLNQVELKAAKLGVKVDEPILTKELNILNVYDWNVFDILILEQNDGTTMNKDEINSPLGIGVLKDSTITLNNIPNETLTLCAMFTTERQAMLNWFRLKMNTKGPLNANEIKMKYTELTDRSKKLSEKIAETTTSIRKHITKAIDNLRMSWLDRDNLIKKVEEIQKELIATSVEAVKAASLNDTMHENDVIAELRKELEQHRKQGETWKDKFLNAESTIRIARARITDLEKQLKQATSQSQTLSIKLREFEQQSRHRETSFEQRSKRLLEITKKDESTFETLSRQRDAFELRAKELHAQLEAGKAEWEKKENDLRTALIAAESRLKEESSARYQAGDREKCALSALAESESIWQQITDRCDKVLEIHRSNRGNFLPPCVTTPDDHSVRLWEELERTRRDLEQVSEHLRLCKRDKDNFLQTLAKIAQCEDSESKREKLAAELLEKEKKIVELESNLECLKAELDKKSQMLADNEKQITDLNITVMKIKNYEHFVKPTTTDGLEQQILDLHMQLASLTQERNSLRFRVARSSLLLERHENILEQQHNLLTLKDEIQSMMNLPNERDKFVIKNRQEMQSKLASIMKTTSRTWSALELGVVKQMRLERAVVAQNEQIQREQKLRVELESDRAILERKLLKAQLPDICTHNSP